MALFRTFSSLLAASLMLCASAASAAVQSYRYDTVHSQVVFSISHDGYSRPFGRLHIANGWLKFDPDNWPASSTELDIDLASLDMGDADWNKAVLKPSLLDLDKARYAHFASTSVERSDDSHGVLHGRLTLRGVTRPLDIRFTFNRLAKTIYGLHTVAGFSATASLDRRDFGITAFGNSIGDQVTVWMELEAIRDDRAAPGAPSGTSDHPQASVMPATARDTSLQPTPVGHSSRWVSPSSRWIPAFTGMAMTPARGFMPMPSSNNQDPS